MDCPSSSLHLFTMDNKIKDVLESLRLNRLSVCSFLEAFLISGSNSAKISCGMYYKDGGMARVLKAMLENSEYTLKHRQTTVRNCQLYEDFGPYFNNIIIHMLHLEVVTVAKDPIMHLKPEDVSPKMCKEFSFEQYEKLYLAKAPIYFGLLRLLCCVDDAMKPLRGGDMGEPLDPEELEEEIEEVVNDDSSENDDPYCKIGMQDAVASESDDEVELEVTEESQRSPRKP